MKFSTLLLSIALVAATISHSDEADRKALFGELHIHTGWSFDAYVFNVRATPDDAYEFGKGGPLKHPLGKTYQLSRPLDFMAVTDHGIYMGVMARMADESSPLNKHPLAKKVNDPENPRSTTNTHRSTQTPPKPSHLCSSVSIGG